MGPPSQREISLSETRSVVMEPKMDAPKLPLPMGSEAVS